MVVGYHHLRKPPVGASTKKVHLLKVPTVKVDSTESRLVKLRFMWSPVTYCTSGCMLIISLDTYIHTDTCMTNKQFENKDIYKPNKSEHD